MDFVKKYLAYGIYILVVLASIGIYAWSIMINNQNIKEYKDIESKYKTASSLSSKAVHENEIKFYNDNIKLAEEDKKNVIDFCKMTSSRPFLFIKIFPFAPQDVRKQYYTNFGGEYCKAIENYLNVLHASDKPSALEEKNYLDNSKRTTTDPAGGGADMRRGGGGDLGMGMTSGSADQKLLIEMREKRAEEISVYANLESFVLYDFWQNHDGSTGTTAELQNDSWYSQIAHWIQEDVVLSINKINSTSNSVSENPVKRLIEISFSGPAATSGSGSGAAAGVGGRAMVGAMRARPITTAARGAINSSGIGVASRTGNIGSLPGIVENAGGGAGATGARSGINALQSPSYQMTIPWTGHYTNTLTDVYHFTTSMIVESNKVNELINALQSARSNPDGTNSRNQITVLQYDLLPVNIQAEEIDGYYYGSGSLVQANIICEYVFFKAGYDSKVPESIKGGATEATAKPAAPAPNPMNNLRGRRF